MQNSYYNDINAFPKKKVSIKQAVQILKRNGIQTTDEQARIILNFLNVLAKVSNAPKYSDE
jgi:hypothetical protein